MTKLVRLAAIAIAAVTIASHARAQGPGPESQGRAAIQEPGVSAFYQSLGVGQAGHRAPAESYAATDASGATSQPAKSVHKDKHSSGRR